MFEFSISSTLDASRDDVWLHAVSAAGVNREFQPLLRMTFPAGLEAIADDWVPGERICRSWILLFGLLPVDFDDLVLVEVEAGHRFLERSTMFTQSLWEHERSLRSEDGRCRLTDRVRFVPKVAALGGLQRLVFRKVFQLRHWNLQRLFGAAQD